MNARTTALSALIACRKQGAWADGILKEYISRDRLDRRDAALASRLCYGVLQNRMLLDYEISYCVTGSLNKLHPITLDILRLGMYQILLMDKIPVSAAVNEAVEQGKKYVNRGAAGLINGVLRRAAREKDSLPQPDSRAVRYSHPQQLVDLLIDSVGEQQIDSLLASHNTAPQTVIQANPLAASPETVREELEEAGVQLTFHPWLSNAWYASGTGSLESLPMFQQGGFFVQDPAARLVVLAAGLKPGMHVLDGCAAPGGKSFAAAIEMKNKGKIVSCDIHAHKIKLLEKGAERLAISIITPVLQDGRSFCPEWEKKMDAVIADVPCSGLGVIRKKPDIRYKDLEKLSNLPAIQLEILENLSRYVKAGGILIYSTCTILRRENEDVINAFLNCHPEYHLEPFTLPIGLHDSCNGFITLLPNQHETDGFFICKLRRKA